MAVPQPDDQVSFQVDGREVARHHHGAGVPRPYLFPLIGPAGLPVTRIGHPRDPHGHRHHLSVWIGHRSVAGHNFWEAGGAARIAVERLVALEDGASAALSLRARWLDPEGRPLLADERRWVLAPKYETIDDGGFGEWTLDLTLELHATELALLDRTPFGLLGVRVARTMGTRDGGGVVTNSEGRVNEAQLMPHRRARWIDYAGPVAPGLWNGIALFDHPRNPEHPAYFHVRGDGWMGASLTHGAAITVAPGQPLRLRYRLWVHRGAHDGRATEDEWRRFAQT
jgi:hypothetical protein